LPAKTGRRLRDRSRRAARTKVCVKDLVLYENIEGKRLSFFPSAWTFEAKGTDLGVASRGRRTHLHE
jgi:hypothetical protein